MTLNVNLGKIKSPNFAKYGAAIKSFLRPTFHRPRQFIDRAKKRQLIENNSSTQQLIDLTTH